MISRARHARWIRRYYQIQRLHAQHVGITTIHVLNKMNCYIVTRHEMSGDRSRDIGERFAPIQDPCEG
jgi:hypothetical protein